jgi:ribonuclease E
MSNTSPEPQGSGSVPSTDNATSQPKDGQNSEAVAAGSAAGTNANRRRRRGSRGGKNRNSGAARAGGSTSSTSTPSGVSSGSSGSSDVREDSSKPVSSVSQSPAQTGESPQIGDSRPAVAEPSSPETVGHGGGAAPATTTEGDRRRRRRGGRRRGGAKKPSDSSLDSSDGPIELDEETLEKRRGKERKGRPVGRYMMCVQVREGATQIAVLEGRNLIEHYVSRPHDDTTQIDGNIYLSRVQNVLPGMEAAFIDIGTPKNAVLYRGDVRFDAEDVEGRPKSDAARIEQMIKTGQTLVCQVTKNPIGAKGARLTQEVSLPGRFVVLIPNNSTYGISKRLPDDERKRLRKILDEVKPEEHGIIVRTAAEGVTADELRRDVKRLIGLWEEIETNIFTAQAPALLYREPDMAVRIIREEFNRNYRSVVIDDQALYEEVRDYVSSISPELADRIEYYDRSAEPLPLFERYHVHEQVHKALDRKVWLPSGGSLIIERTEALTVIDVNTGKNVGKSNLEETVFRNNLEAAEEIAHQLRLRDIGGIIVIDFIDMEIKKNRDEVLNRLREALSRDKTRTQAYPIGELGLVEMTRKRISEGLVESFSEPCPSCNGRGFIIDESLMAD